MSLADFITDTLTLDDPGCLFASYLDALGEYGVDQVVYLSVHNTPYNDTEIPAITHSYPEDWMSYYAENGYASLDPTLQHGKSVRNAFTWADMMASMNLTPKQAKVMHQGEEAGLKNGVGVPLHGPMGEIFGLGLASSNGNPDLGRHLKEIQILSTHFHVLYAGMYDHKRKADGVSLTPRELEVLKWCAVGKSNWSIGEILGISEHGVDFHMRNILRKLEADNRISAVVKALHGGLVIL